MLIVARLRHFQQMYQRSRSAWALEQVKKYETAIDQELNIYEKLNTNNSELPPAPVKISLKNEPIK